MKEHGTPLRRLAEVKLSCGRYFLDVAGIALAMEGDPCREAELPDDVYPPIPEAEMASATIGDRPITEIPLKVVRFFRGERWTEAMLRYVAEKINEAVN